MLEPDLKWQRTILDTGAGERHQPRESLLPTCQAAEEALVARQSRRPVVIQVGTAIKDLHRMVPPPAVSEGHSGDHLVNNDMMGALGGAGAAGGAVGRRQSNKDIHRGPSNASSAYSTGRAQSQVSDDMPGPGIAVGAPGAYHHDEGPYYNEAAPQHGPYGDGSYGGEQPIIRDVQARRNTRIERAPTFPQQQGNSGVATNF